MLNEKLAVLMSRYLSKEASPAEQEELFALLENDPQRQYLFDLLTNFWAPSPSLQPKDSDDDHFNHILALANEEAALAEQLRQRIHEQIPEQISLPSPSRVFRYRKIYAWSAAVAAIFIAALIYLYDLFPPNNPPLDTALAPVHKNEVKAKSGARSRLTLPDGTKVWLNADSRIIYGNGFNVRSREVELEGEAFFDVVKNASRPFIVHAAGIDIKVMGTAFNVKSYPLEPTTETTLMRGSVEVVKANEPSGAKIILQPYEKLVFTKAIDSMRLLSVGKILPQEMLIIAVAPNLPDSVMKETSWMYNRLFFDGDTFRELAVKMERWFNVNIHFRDETVAEYQFKGVFKNETIIQALDALQVTADFKYSIHGNDIEIFKGRRK